MFAPESAFPSADDLRRIHRRKELFGNLFFVPLPCVLTLILTLAVLDIRTVCEYPHLFTLMNTLLLGAAPFLVAGIAASAFMTSGNPSVLLLGCGMTAWGLGGLTCSWLLASRGPNATITVYNSSALLGAFFHAAGAALAFAAPAWRPEQNRKALALSAYLLAASAVGIIFMAARQALTPLFIVQGLGHTHTGRAALLTAIALFAFSSVLSLIRYFDTGWRLLRWYGLGLALVSVGLTGIVLQKAVGSPVGWVGRFAQYAGTLYILAGVLGFFRTLQRKGGSIDASLNAAFLEAEAKYRALIDASAGGIAEDTRDRAEKTLKRLEADMRLAVAATGIGTYSYEFDRGEAVYSPQFLALYGLAPDGTVELAADLAPRALHPEDREGFLSSMKQANDPNGSGSFTHEYRIILPDGQARWLRAMGRTTFSGPGARPLRANGIIQDITERKQAETAMASIQKLESVGILAGGIAHDFNNLLTAILGNISLLQSGLPPDSEALELTKEAENACQTAKGLARQLLTFSRGGLPVVKVVDLRNLLTTSAGFAARGSKARCVFDLGDAPLAVSADKDQLSQVIQNLVINAVQAMPEGGNIAIQASPIAARDGELPPLAAGRYVRVTVSDQGEGIPAAHLSKVFDPYFSTKAVGRGLGLAVCHSIVTKHGGRISAESKPGAGALFTLHLPAADAAALPPDNERPAVTSGSGKVLIMDDEAQVCRVLKWMLERLGYQAESVADGKSALEAYKAALAAGRPYDVVIMDLTIPGGMGGQEAVGRLLKLDPKALAIVSSGYANDPVMSDWADHGFCGVLGKPYSVEDVSDALRRAVGSKAH